MNKPIIAVSAIAALSHLAPITGFSEPTPLNEVGLYMNEDGTGITGSFINNDPGDVYLVLIYIGRFES